MLVRKLKLRLLKTRFAPPFKEAFVVKYVVKGFHKQVKLVKSLIDRHYSKKLEHSSHTMEKVVKGLKMLKIFGRSSDIFEEIDHKVRVHYGLNQMKRILLKKHKLKKHLMNLFGAYRFNH